MLRKPSPLGRLLSRIPTGKFFRYLIVGVWNTAFGYCTFAGCLFLFSHLLSPSVLYLAAIAASVVSTPINITVAYFGYKFFVFRTRGNHLREWLKSFAVYGTGMIPGLVALGGVTRLTQSLLHRYHAPLASLLAAIEQHLSGKPLATLHSVATSHSLAGYLAGLFVMGFTTIFSFIGHQNVTFKTRPQKTNEDLAR